MKDYTFNNLLIKEKSKPKIYIPILTRLDLENDIRKALRTGLSVKEVAHDCRCGTHTVYRIKKKYY